MNATKKTLGPWGYFSLLIASCFVSIPQANAFSWQAFWQQSFKGFASIIEWATPVQTVQAQALEPSRVRRDDLSGRLRSETKTITTKEKSSKTAQKTKTITPTKVTKPIEKIDPIRVVMRPEPQPSLTRYLDFVVPEHLIATLLEPAHREESGTLTPEILKSIHHHVTHPQLRAQGIKQLVGVSHSSFKDSSPSRKHNIFTSIEKFDGQILPRGEEFSFNDILKDASSANGFVKAKVIIAGQTRWGWGGGICQLSTSIFRAAFNTGLPITERRNHSFQVKYYAPQGSDATIYLGSQDMKFLNTTPGDIMMQIITREDDLLVLFYGTKDRTVTVEAPTQNGMNYTWDRIIKKNRQEEVAQETFKSYYREEVVARGGDEA